MLHDLIVHGKDLVNLAVIQDKRKKALRPKPEGFRKRHVRTEPPPRRAPEPLAWRAFPLPRG